MNSLTFIHRNLLCALISVVGLLLLPACATPNRSKPECTYTKEELKSIRQQANSGHDVMLLKLANLYSFGQCVHKDTKYAFTLRQQAAAQGNATAQSEVARSYYSGQVIGLDFIKQDFIKAEYWFRRAAEQGDRFAQHQLGIMYQRGIGIDQNLEEAKKWYEKSAEQGDYGSRQALITQKRLHQLIYGSRSGG